MGTINYKTSDYITIGYNCDWDPADFDSWEDMDREKQIDIDDMFYHLRHMLERERFYYFHVCLEPGYYEGFSLMIENNFPVAFDGWEDKRAAQQEITQIRRFLAACVAFGLVEVWPGWCTRYNSREDTIKAIRAAVREMREAVQNTPTWGQYSRGEK